MSAIAPSITDKPKARVVGEHYTLKKGDLDSELNKVVEEIILNSDHFVVYLATDLSIQWRTTDDHVESAHCGEILNLVATLEGQSQFLIDRVVAIGIRSRIAEGLARCLAGYPKENSLSVLREAEQELAARNKETSWMWYFRSAYLVTGSLVVCFAMFWAWREHFRLLLGHTAFEVLLGSLCGSVGALLSVTARGDRLVMDANAGKRIHTLEGLSRIGAGLIGALLVALAIKSGLVLGGVQFSGNQLALLLAFCIVAGASERLVPSLIESVESSAATTREKNRRSQRK